jgi:hypothetical protein
MSEQIQVCEGWWRQRCGDIVRVWRNDEDDVDYPWASGIGTYRHDGSSLVHIRAAEDLVEFLGVDDPTRRPAMNDRRELVRQFAVALLTACGNALAPHDAWGLAAEMADAEPKGG